jgi:iron only hydrogenase large subunit-like protein
MAMKTFHELYLEILKQEAREGRHLIEDYNPYHLDCLLHPEKHAPIIAAEDCEECAYERACVNSCMFDAIEDNGGKLRINPKKCVGCAACLEACKLEHLQASKDVFPVLKTVREKKRDVYALIAPAFVGQFQDDVTPGKLRAAFKALGFKGMIEVAVFADILTLKEALEFDKNIVNKADYQLTSCCCPIWISMIRNIYKELMPRVPGAVSPMVAAGRAVKQIYPDAVTVFVGPCLAKKREAVEPDIADAVDYVLTFQEVADIFQAADIKPEDLVENEQEHSSRAGRIYASTGGVSEAVKETVKQLNPDREIMVRAEQADGVKNCRALIERLQKGEREANFYEGMGCEGGCVGGPRALIDKDLGNKQAKQYGEIATYKTPLENPYVMELLIRLGFSSVEDLLEKSDIFTRVFD